MSDRNRFFLLAVGHFVLTLVTLLTGLSITMAAFEGEGSGFGGTALLWVSRVIIFPLGTFGGELVTQRGFPVENLLLALNSMLWAAVGVWVWRRVRERRAVEKGLNP